MRNLKPSLIGLVLSVFSAACVVCAAGLKNETHKHRVIVTTDLGADPDDEQSLVRLFVSTNEFDIEGLIASAGTFSMLAEKKNILAALDEYHNFDENLINTIPDSPPPMHCVLSRLKAKGTTMASGSSGDAASKPTQILSVRVRLVKLPRPSSISKWKKEFQKEFQERAD